MILIEAKMNSASPYIPTAKMFRQMMRMMIKLIQIAALYCPSWSQNLMTRAAAEISAQSVMEYWYLESLKMLTSL